MDKNQFYMICCLSTIIRMRKLRLFAVSSRKNHHYMRFMQFGHAPSRLSRKGWTCWGECCCVWLICGTDEWFSGGQSLAWIGLNHVVWGGRGSGSGRAYVKPPCIWRLGTGFVRSAVSCRWDLSLGWQCWRNPQSSRSQRCVFGEAWQRRVDQRSMGQRCALYGQAGHHCAWYLVGVS